MGLERERDRDAHTVVGRYALHDKIASGGMATVHLGRLLGPVGFSRTVAIKRMLPQFVSDPGFVSMFVDEARLASRIRHPNVVPTLDVVVQDGELFLVLEYVHGETLSKLIKAVHARNERIPPDIAAAIVCGMLHGLHAAHNVKNESGKPLGLVHRDVSPQNVLVGTDGTARLLDFGVAKAAGRLQITTKGQVKGKLAYMAPEQVKGEVTPQSDVYAASAVLWEALTCQRLFEHVSWSNVAQVIREREVEAPSRVMPGIPRELDAVVMRGLEKQAHKRFASALEMALAIEGCVPIATAHELGEWVAQTAGEVLDLRAQKIAEIESHTSESTMAVASIVINENSAALPPLATSSEMATRADKDRVVAPTVVQAGIDEASDSRSGTPFTQISTIETARPSEGPGPSRRQLAAITATIACVALGMMFFLRTRAHKLPNFSLFHRATANTVVAPVVPPPIEPVEKTVASPDPLQPTGIDPATLAVDTSGASPSSSASPPPASSSRTASKHARPVPKRAPPTKSGS